MVHMCRGLYIVPTQTKMATGSLLSIRLRVVAVSVILTGLVFSPVAQATEPYGPDRTVCDPNAQSQANSGPLRPKLPGRYVMRVEQNLEEKNRTVESRMLFDFNRNRGAVFQWDRGIHLHIYYNFDTDQLITIALPDRANPNIHYTRCDVQTLSTANTTLNFFAINYINGTQHIETADDMLRGIHPSVYLGQVKRDDDIITEAWRSCIYLPSQDATFNATWYYTARDTWMSTLGPLVQAPVSLHIQGRSGGSQANAFDNIFTFSDFRPNDTDVSVANQEFETPQGVYCKGRVNTMAMPNITNNLSFKTEALDIGTQHITYVEEYYDYEMRVVRYEMGAGPQRKTVVLDFNTGVSYTMYKAAGNCSASPISQLASVSDPQHPGSVRMKNSEEFLGIGRHKFTYTGQRTVRGIECDVWLAVREDWPPEAPFQTNWEWYFTTSSWMASVGQRYEIRLPIQLRVTAEDTAAVGFEQIHNVYDYKEKQNQPWDFSISPCFNSLQRKEYTFTIPGNYSQYVAPDKDNFLYFFTLAVTAHAQVSFLRVANVQFDFDDVNIYASFSLLDKTPITGDVSDAVPERNLAQAAAILESDVTGGYFDVQLQMQKLGTLQSLRVTSFAIGTAPTLQPQPPPPRQQQQHHQQQQRQRRDSGTVAAASQQTVKGWREERGSGGLQLDVAAPAPPDDSTTYSSGAMAGLGVAMVVMGYCLGFIVTVMGYRRFRLPPSADMGNPLTELPADRQ